MKNYKDIENEARGKYPATEIMQLISIDTNKWDEMLDKQSAHISAATAERLRMSRIMEQASGDGWIYAEYDRLWYKTNDKSKTTPELLQLFISKNPK